MLETKSKTWKTVATGVEKFIRWNMDGRREIEDMATDAKTLDVRSKGVKHAQPSAGATPPSSEASPSAALIVPCNQALARKLPPALLAARRRRGRRSDSGALRQL